MNQQIQESLVRYRRLPPIVRIGVVVALLVLVYVLVNDYAWSAASRFNAEADHIAQTLARAQAGRERLKRDLEHTVVARGTVRLPDNESRGTQAMADAVNEIVQRRSGIGGYSYDSGAVSRLPPNALVGVLPSGVRGARVNGEVKFEATPEDAMAVIAEIESHPSVQGISRVQLTRSAQRRLAVLLTVETWVTVGGSGSPAGGRVGSASAAGRFAP